MARPLKEIDEEQVRKLAAIQCSYAEMAGVLGCDEKTLSNRFSQVIKEGREQGRMSLKRKQYEIAMSGNVTMLIWLGKIVLDQIEKKEVQIKTDHDEELKAKVKAVPIASLIKLAKGA
jgi:gamma-glutamylcysteine synthetase